MDNSGYVANVRLRTIWVKISARCESSNARDGRVRSVLLKMNRCPRECAKPVDTHADFQNSKKWRRLKLMNGNENIVLALILSILRYDRHEEELREWDRQQHRNGSVDVAKAVILLVKRYAGTVLVRKRFGFVHHAVWLILCLLGIVNNVDKVPCEPNVSPNSKLTRRQTCPDRIEKSIVKCSRDEPQPCSAIKSSKKVLPSFLEIQQLCITCRYKRAT